MGTITAYPPAAAPSAPANVLAYAQIIAGQSGIGTGATDVAGLAVTVFVPEGRRIRLSAFGVIQKKTSASFVWMRIHEGAVPVASSLATYGATDEYGTLSPSVVLTPTAGVHTYRVVMYCGANTVDLLALTDYPAYILAEDITGQSAPAPPASVPVGVLGYGSYTTGSPVSIPSGAYDVPNCSVNVVVPAGRQLRITTFVCQYAGAVSHETRVLADGVALNRCYYGSPPGIVTHAWSVIDSPSAGAHTYKLQTNNGAAGTMYCDGTNESYILVEDITPTPMPANTAPSSTLAYTEVLANQSGLVGFTDLTGLSVTVTVPAGRRLRITGYVPQFNRTAGTATWTTLYVFEGATQLGYQTEKNANDWTGATVMHVLTPSAGTHTYKLRFNGDGTQQMNAAADGPAWILVEDITPVALLPTAIVPGAIVCTSSARPASPALGTQIFESDTLRGRQWDGTAWRLIGPRVPVALVRQTTAGQAISGSWVALTFASGTVVEDTWNSWSAGQPTRLTCQEAGVYNIEGTVGWVGTAGGSRGAGLRKNGTGATGPGLGTNLAAPNTTWSFKNNVVANGVRLTVGDYVELVAVTTVNANTINEDGDSHLAWTYVGA